MNYLSLCAIVKNEALYIEEWLRYHAALGIERFYIYENESTDLTLSILHNLKRTYPVTLKQIKGVVAQPKAYEECLNNVLNATRWVTFIDADEFIVPSIPLKTWLKDYEKYPGVCMHWYLFGSNSWQNYEAKPVTERFTKRQKDINPHIKCFVDPRRTHKYFTPHRFTHPGSHLVDEHFKEVPDDDPIPPNGTCDFIQLNHYCTKSFEECKERRSRLRADTGTLRDMPQFFYDHDRNEVEDFKARDFYRSLK